MKRIIFLLSIVFALSSVTAQEITGDWNGVLSIQGMKLRLVFHITKTDTGFNATIDSPDQGAKGIPMTSAKFNNNVLTLEHTAAKIVFSGTLDKMGFVTGNFVQGGMTLPLMLTRKEVVVEKPKRPQDPKKPYPYNSEDITFVNNKDSITLAGTFTYPTGKGKFPVVVLITGSGAQNRDEELMGHKPFLVLSDYLTRNGIAVLRYDDRGSYASKGNFAKATTADFARDVEAAVQYLKTRKEINPKKIGLIGHSEGGLIAPMVAASNKDVNFIVMMAGPGISGAEILLRQQELIGRANGIKEEDIAETREMNTAIYKYINDIKDADSLRNVLTNFVKAKMQENTKLPSDKAAQELAESQIAQIMSTWMLYFMRYNPTPTLEKVKCPVLAINGSKDLQVPAEINLQTIEKALKKAGNKKYVVKELAGLNHLFQECKTGSPNEYAEIEQTISPVALETMLKWIKGL